MSDVTALGALVLLGLALATTMAVYSIVRLGREIWRRAQLESANQGRLGPGVRVRIAFPHQGLRLARATGTVLRRESEGFWLVELDEPAYHNGDPWVPRLLTAVREKEDNLEILG